MIFVIGPYDMQEEKTCELKSKKASLIPTPVCLYFYFLDLESVPFHRVGRNYNPFAINLSFPRKEFFWVKLTEWKNPFCKNSMLIY